MLVVDHLLRAVEAAAADRLAVQGSEGVDRASGTLARSRAQLILANRIADTDDHADRLHDNASHSQDAMFYRLGE